jgi:chromosome segregation ATPase
MSLQEAMEDLKKQIAAAEAEESEQEETVSEAEPEAKEEEKPEAPVVEEEKKPEPEPEEKLDNSAYARMRREAAAAKRLAEEEAGKRAALEAELEKLRTGGAETESAEEIIPDEVTELVQERRLAKAEREFEALEAEFKAQAPDYADVAAQYSKALAQSIRTMNPRMPIEDVIKETKKTLLVRAGEYMNKGYNPIEEIYNEAKELGFKALPKEEAKPLPEEIKPDFKKVAENRKKSTGMAATGGESVAQVTKSSAADMTVEEWAKLSPADKKRLMYG